MKINIAIDGPGAAGKSTIAKVLAKHLGYVHLDTGAMYRCCAYYAHTHNIDIQDDRALEKMLNNIDIRFIGQTKVFIADEDVSEIIRTNENSMRTSLISQKKIVREKMVDLQRKVSTDKGYILDGRDIGSVVLKDAELKLYIIASVESRAKRRYDEYVAKQIEADYEAIAADLEQRDYQDMNRKESPLTKASDAIEIDTSNLSVNEVCEAVMRLVNKKIGK